MSVMSLTANTRLFARKGEASPAGVAMTRFAAEKPRAPVEPDDGRASAATSSGAADGPATSLSFLIQRNTAPVAKAGAGDNGERGGVASARPEAAKRRRPRADAEPSWSAGRAAARELAAGGADAGAEAWHKLSFRVRQDQYRKLKALSGLWGASFQGILERAVAAFVDSAIGDETEWDA